MKILRPATAAAALGAILRWGPASPGAQRRRHRPPTQSRQFLRPGTPTPSPKDPAGNAAPPSTVAPPVVPAPPSYRRPARCAGSAPVRLRPARPGAHDPAAGARPAARRSTGAAAMVPPPARRACRKRS